VVTDHRNPIQFDHHHPERVAEVQFDSTRPCTLPGCDPIELLPEVFASLRPPVLSDNPPGLEFPCFIIVLR